MSKINKHGLKMIGLKKASGETCEWAGCTQISYDMETGEILIDDHATSNEWTEYHDPDVITVATVSRHMTMQEIADAIAEKVEYHKLILDSPDHCDDGTFTLKANPAW